LKTGTNPYSLPYATITDPRGKAGNFQVHVLSSSPMQSGATPGIRKWGAPVKIGGAQSLPSLFFSLPSPFSPYTPFFPLPFPFPLSLHFPFSLPIPFLFRGGGRPFPQTQLGVWGSAVSSPSGSGRSPAAKRILVHFSSKIFAFGLPQPPIFWC